MPTTVDHMYVEVDTLAAEADVLLANCSRIRTDGVHTDSSYQDRRKKRRIEGSLRELNYFNV